MSKGRILVVDDEPEIVKGIAIRLKSCGYDVLTAMDGRQATNLAIKEQPDLIILDIRMPGVSGHLVVQRLRNSVKTCHIPVIFLTAHTSEQDYRQAIERGVEKYITKPFQPEELMAVIDLLMMRKAQMH